MFFIQHKFLSNVTYYYLLLYCFQTSCNFDNFPVQILSTHIFWKCNNINAIPPDSQPSRLSRSSILNDVLESVVTKDYCASVHKSEFQGTWLLDQVPISQTQ